MLRSPDGFDYKTVILRKVEKTATFARRSNLRKSIFASERNLINRYKNMREAPMYKIISGIDMRGFSDVAKHPRTVVFEFKVKP
jgi:hypothetical protein